MALEPNIRITPAQPQSAQAAEPEGGAELFGELLSMVVPGAGSGAGQDVKTPSIPGISVPGIPVPGSDSIAEAPAVTVPTLLPDGEESAATGDDAGDKGDGKDSETPETVLLNLVQTSQSIPVVPVPQAATVQTESSGQTATQPALAAALTAQTAMPAPVQTIAAAPAAAPLPNGLQAILSALPAKADAPGQTKTGAKTAAVPDNGNDAGEGTDGDVDLLSLAKAILDPKAAKPAGAVHPQADAKPIAANPAEPARQQQSDSASVQPSSSPSPAPLPRIDAPQPAAFAIAPTANTSISAPTATAPQPAPADAMIEKHLDLAHDHQWLDQLARDIARSGGEGGLRFRLNPEHLGTLHVELNNGSAGTSLRLTTDTDAARAIIADAQPKLVAEARAHGVRIAETHVGTGAGGQQAFGDPRRQAEHHSEPFLRTARQGRTEAAAAVKAARTASERYA